MTGERDDQGLQGAFDALRADLAGKVEVPPFEGVRRRYRRRRRARLTGSAALLGVVAVTAAVVAPQLGSGGGSVTPVAPPRVTVTVTVPPSPVSSLGPLALDDVSFADSGHGVALGRRCTGGRCALVAATSDDGGSTFGPEHLIATAAGPTADARKVAAVAGTGIVYAYGPGLYVSTDGGGSWHDVQPFGTTVVDLAYRDKMLTLLVTSAVAQVARGTVGATTATYTFSDVQGSTGSGVRLQQPPDGTQIVTSSAGISLRPAGKSAWQQRSFPAGCARPSVSAVGAATWWLLCAGPRGAGVQSKAVYLTRDAGSSWQARAAPPSDGFADTVTALNATTAFLSGQNTPLVQSTDGGSSWQQTLPRAGGYGEPHVLGGHTWVVSGSSVYRRVGGGGWESVDLS